VAPHIDPFDGETCERERGALDGVRRAEIREDRPMVIHIGVHVDELNAGGGDGVTEGPDQRAITSLADVGDCFEKCLGGTRALRQWFEMGA
jgi:hypothetical protein